MSYSQLRQDLWVLDKLKNKRNGVFIDVGAHTGIELSNTYLLEKDYGWTGVCVECNTQSLPELKKNRAAQICEKAAFSTSGLTLQFDQNVDPTMSGILLHKNGNTTVETISLNDIVEKYNLGTEIDYVSMDTEGSELNILNAFDFKKYKVKCWTIEHNIYSNGDFANLSGLINCLLFNNYLVKMHDWDIFAVLDNFEPEFHKA